MTIAKQDPVAWRRRVDVKLNFLTKGYEELSATITGYAQERADHMVLTKSIDKKLDDLTASTQDMVNFANRAKLTTRFLKWVGCRTQKIMTLIGQMGVALLTVLTFYWVVEKGGSWTKAFINIFNGNLN